MQPQYPQQNQPAYQQYNQYPPQEQQPPKQGGWGCVTWMVVVVLGIFLSFAAMGIVIDMRDPDLRDMKFISSGNALLACTPRELHGCQVLYTRANGTVAVFEPGLIEASGACGRDAHSAATIMRATAVSRCAASSQDIGTEAQCLMRFGVLTAPAESARQRTLRNAPPHGGASIKCSEGHHSGEFEGFLPL